MLKFAMVGLVGLTLTAVIATPPNENVRGLRDGLTNYSSGIAPVIPFTTAIKVTPDPANIWHWTDIIEANPDTVVDRNVMIDFDGDGADETHRPAFRVMITDVQMLGFRLLAGRVAVQLRTGDGNVLWDISPVPTAHTVENGIAGFDAIGHYEKSFQTPLVLPLGSKLVVRLNPLSRFAAVRRKDSVDRAAQQARDREEQAAWRPCPSCGAEFTLMTGEGMSTSETESWMLVCASCGADLSGFVRGE